MTCDSCGQCTADPDRDSEDPVGNPKPLKWHKTKRIEINNKFVLQPYARECYHCWYTRQKHDSKISQAQLNENRKADTQLDTKFWDDRKNLVQGKKNNNSTKAAAITESKKTSYNDDYVEGTFEPIFEFATKRFLTFDPDDVEGLIELIRQNYKQYSIGHDKNNTLGVKIPDLTGGAYRWK